MLANGGDIFLTLLSGCTRAHGYCYFSAGRDQTTAFWSTSLQRDCIARYVLLVSLRLVGERRPRGLGDFVTHPGIK